VDIDFFYTKKLVSNKMSAVFKIFVDFDRTITKVDVGDSIFSKFADKEQVDIIIANLLEGKISAMQSWRSLCDITCNINKDEFDKFIDSIDIDQSFRKLVDYCNSKGIELFILSDGFDYYINRILEKESISCLKLYSNKLTLDASGKLLPEFPFYDENCTNSANCKRNHIINNSSDEDYTVFIGDGNSDKFTAEYCDFIFAKDDLLKFCERERITYFPFGDFNDVVDRIKQLTLKKRLKKRHQAGLKRRETYMIE
jgi:2,3-diketo-5-methylthio-1-phosphopentane phosphatase